MHQKIDIFDFDGTLISINSFHLFLFFLGFRGLLSLRLPTLGNLISAVFARFTKRISHLEFKTKINELGLLLTRDEGVQFCKWLAFFKRSSVIEALKRSYASPDALCIIASAAPYAYMRYVAYEFPVDLVVSFGGPGNFTSPLVDNIGDNKLVNVSAHLNIDVCRLNILYTDHIDDLPLALAADNVFLVRPDIKFVDALEARSVKFTVI